MQRDSSLDFVRACCSIGIVAYHFSCHLPTDTFYPFLKTANGDWGSIIVTVFFALSGLLLYRNNPQIPSLKTFYYKRWKSIFPSFYLAFFYCFFNNALASNTLFGPMSIFSTS